MPGNINNDDNINTADAQWLLSHLAQMNAPNTPTVSWFNP
tara:strand:+ start:74 stop:193 length:120 start_codon:yes stop_codon:yes gene_type:complete